MVAVKLVVLGLVLLVLFITAMFLWFYRRLVVPRELERKRLAREFEISLKRMAEGSDNDFAKLDARKNRMSASDNERFQVARATYEQLGAEQRKIASAASYARRVARLGNLYGNVFTADNTEKRTELLVEYLEISLSMRRVGQPDMKPPAFMTYDQARVKLVEALNEHYDELVVGAPDKVEVFDKLGFWLDEMEYLNNKFDLDEVELDLRDIPEAWDDWLITHYDVPLFEQFRVDPDAVVQAFVDIQLAAVTAIIDLDECNVKLIRALCLDSTGIRAAIGEPVLFELTKLTYAFNKERKAALAIA